MASLEFEIADRPDEFEAIHRLNYRTLVEEIPQHADNPEGRLVNRFHEENCYIVCLSAGQLAGMLALRSRRAFPLDLKLPNLDSLLPPARRTGEVRLLAVEQGFRHTRVAPGLFALLERACLARNLELLVVSATTRQRRLYDRLGLVPFGPIVGHVGAHFQPMCLTLDRYRRVRAGYVWHRTA